MNDLLKKGFFLGLGIAAASKEKVEKYVDELVVRGKLTPKEAEDVIDSFVKKGEEAGVKWQDRKKDKVKSVLDEYDVVDRQSYLNLLDRVEAIEEKLGMTPYEEEELDEEAFDPQEED